MTNQADSPPVDDDLPADPRMRLIVATIREIEAKNMAQITVRGIASAADMNVASINYHFGSKQNLLEAAIVGSVSHIIADLDEMLPLFADDPHATLTQILRYILEGSLRYPRLSRAHLYDAFTADDYTGPFFRQFPPFLERLSTALNEAVPSLSTTAASQRVTAAVSAVLLPALFPPFFASDTADTPESRAMLVESLTTAALAPMQK